jgi:hypothetical protein
LEWPTDTIEKHVNREGLARFIHWGFETAVPRRVGDAVFGGIGDAAVGV